MIKIETGKKKELNYTSRNEDYNTDLMDGLSRKASDKFLAIPVGRPYSAASPQDLLQIC